MRARLQDASSHILCGYAEVTYGLKIGEKMEKEIYYKASQNNGRDGYLWAWKESWDANVFGVAYSIGEIKRRATRMFPNYDCILIAL